MKRILIALVAVVSLAVLLPQTAAASFGIKGGLAWPNLKFTGDDMTGLSDLKEPVGGIYFDLAIAGPVSIEPEVLYVRMGAHQDLSSGLWGEDRLDYIQVPLLLKVKILPGLIRPFVFGGGYGSYLFKATGVYYNGTTQTSTDIKDQIKKYDYGVIFGAGVEFKAAFLKISAEGRYNMGLANINNSSTEGMTVKNKGLMALIGIAF